MKKWLIPALLAGGILLLSAPTAPAAFPGANAELLFDASVDEDGDGVGTAMIGTLTLDPVSGRGVPTMITEGSDPASAPDGVRIAFVREGDIWVRGGDGTERRLTVDPASDLEPAWSPDGAQIVFTSNRAGGPDLYSVDVATDTVQRLTQGEGTSANSEAAWSPDGAHIAFTHETPDSAGSAETTPELWLMDAPGTGATFPIDPEAAAKQLTSVACFDDGTPCVPNTARGPAGDASWSPDGAELAFASGFGIRGNVYAISVADPTVSRRIAAIDVTHTSLAWSPDGERIALVRRFQFGDHRLSTIANDGSDGKLAFTTCCGYEYISPSANVDWRPGNTPRGPNVRVVLPPVTLTFLNVTVGGTTSITSNVMSPPIPSGFQLLGVVYDITTTASFENPPGGPPGVEVCIDSPDLAARLYHWDGTSWVDVTSSPTATQVCGAVGSLSPFALLLPAADTTPPVLTLPPDCTINATSPAGAVVTCSPTATDNSGDVHISCSPAPGSVFAIGTTIVFCEALDATGNRATGSFRVTVKGAPAQIGDLVQKTLAYLDLPQLKAALKARLEEAAGALVAKNKPAACRALALYIAAVKAAPASTGLTTAEKADLVADATRIRAVIGC